VNQALPDTELDGFVDALADCRDRTTARRERACLRRNAVVGINSTGEASYRVKRLPVERTSLADLGASAAAPPSLARPCCLRVDADADRPRATLRSNLHLARRPNRNAQISSDAVGIGDETIRSHIFHKLFLGLF
jgi:hypothetical protein